jgi:hypothetical protein
MPADLWNVEEKSEEDPGPSKDKIVVSGGSISSMVVFSSENYVELL